MALDKANLIIKSGFLLRLKAILSICSDFLIKNLWNQAINAALALRSELNNRDVTQVPQPCQ